MALGPCSECGSQVSNQAEICPHCGIPFPSGSNAMRVFLVVGFAMLFLLAGIGFLVWYAGPR